MSLMVWGHRGHRYHRYKRYDADYAAKQIPHENSLAACAQTLAATGGIECDVIQSRLKTPYILHDTLFNGMTVYDMQQQLHESDRHHAENRFIFDMTDDEIESLRLQDGQTIPALEHMLALMRDYRGRTINLELKGPNVADVTIRGVERAIYQKHITPQQVIFSSYNLPALRGLRANVGTRFRISLSFMVGSQPMAQMYPNWPLCEQQAYYVPFSIEALQRPDILDIQPDFFNIDVSNMNLETLEALHFFYPKAGIILWCSGEAPPSISSVLVDTAQIYEPSRKLYAVISDYPMDVQNMMRQRGMDVATP